MDWDDNSDEMSLVKEKPNSNEVILNKIEDNNNTYYKYRDTFEDKDITLIIISKNSFEIKINTKSKHFETIKFININTIPNFKEKFYQNAINEDPAKLLYFLNKAYFSVFYSLYWEISGGLNHEKLFHFKKKFITIGSSLKRKFPNAKHLICDYNNENTLSQSESCIIVNQSFFQGMSQIEKAREIILSIIVDDKIKGCESLQDKYFETHIKLPKNSISEVTKRISTTINKRQLSTEEQESIFKLHNTIEIKNLKEFLEKYKKALEANKSENWWQNLFNNNKFILQMLFPYPLISFNREYQIKGSYIEKDNTRILDFIAKNKNTGNTCIIELKKPTTSILGKSEYRNSLKTISNKLSNAINQVNDQIYAFNKNNINKEYRIYSIQGVVIIGKTSSLETEDDKKSFELYRNSFKNIRIITFDEILEQLDSFSNFLTDELK